MAKKLPKGMTAVTPHLVIAGAGKALDFYVRVFGATEDYRLAGPDGKVAHAQIRIGGAPIMLGEEAPDWGAFSPKSLKGSPVAIHLYVDDVDGFMAKAEKGGAKITSPAADMFWGDRYGKLEDPFGHRWSVATFVREVGPEEMDKAMKEMMKDAPKQAA
jgi:PhnB protein